MENSFFDEVLDQLVKQAGQPLPRLAKLSGVAQKTIESWLEGRVKRPRDWRELLRLAKAMRLHVEEVDVLLTSARHKSEALLLTEARSNKDKDALDLLVFWAEESDLRGVAREQQEIFFQSVPPFTDIIDRIEEFDRLIKLTKPGKCIAMICGMAGVGKTALAVKAAHELRPYFPDGVLWAQLDKSDPMSILYTIAITYGNDVSEYRDIVTRSAIVRNILAQKRALIIFDSAQSREDVTHLLPPPSSNCSVIITTHNHRILETGITQIELEPFGLEDSIQLFATQIGKDRTQATIDSITKIIKLVGGLPLALQIVTSDLADITSLTINEYCEGLQDERFRLETLMDYADTNIGVRTSFEVSYNHLPISLQHLYSSLSVLRGKDFTIDAVAQVSKQPILQVKKGLVHLHNLSLIEASLVTNLDLSQSILGGQSAALNPTRYRIHPLLSIFATEKADENLVIYQQRAAVYYAGLTARNRANYRMLRLEWENIAATLPWAIEHQQWSTFIEGITGLTAQNLGIAGFLDAQGYWRIAYDWLKQALSMPQVASDKLTYANLLYTSGVFALRLAEYSEAETDLQQALVELSTIPKSEATILYEGYAFEVLAQLMLALGRPNLARQHAEQGLAVVQHLQTDALRYLEGYLKIRHATILARNFGELASALLEIESALKLLPVHPTAAHVSGLMTLGIICNTQGETDQAKAHWQTGVKAAEAIGDNRRLSGLWRNLAAQADEQGDFLESLQYNQQALELYQRIGDVEGEALVASNLTFTYLAQQGEPEKARPYLETAEKLAKEYKLPDVELFAMVNHAHWHLHFQEYDQASNLLQQAQILSEKIDELPSQVEILRLQADIALHYQEYNKALELIESSIKIGSDNKLEGGIAWRVKGNIYNAMRDKLKAKEAYENSIALLTKYEFEKMRTLLALRNL